MEANFERKKTSCLDMVLQQVQNSEQTLEIKLPEAMPDIGRVLTAWGQPIARSKEWHADMLQFSGGMMVWILYAPEDGSVEQCVQGWIPFQMRWELPDNTREGTLRLWCLPRFVDARSTSPRKILVRAGLAVLAEAYVPTVLETAVSQQKPEDVVILEKTYPFRLAKEGGEKIFLLEEDLHLPDSVPKMVQLITWNIHPRITDQRVLGDKVVFRGNANLHVLYRSEAGQLHGWDFELPFSQYADLQGEYGADARLEVALMPTALELELQDDGVLILKGGMTAQYLITDNEPLTLMEDAYSPVREVEITRENIIPPVVLENRRENISIEQSICAAANLTADVQLLPDFPRQRRTDAGVELEYPGQLQVLYYGEDGALHGTTTRWEGKQVLSADEHSRITIIPIGGEVQAIAGNDRILVKAELTAELTARTEETFSIITRVTLGQQKTLDPNRPSLILRRAGNSSLWDIAKASGSTMEAIQRVNGLSGEPGADQMLLIPVP